MKTLFEQIGISAKIDDLDEAIRPIQEILGQEDGGVAGLFFSGGGFTYELWPSQPAECRHEAIVKYVQFELLHLDAAGDA